MKNTLPHSKARSATQNANCRGIHNKFRLCSQWLAIAVGSPWAFLLALFSIVIWAVLGPIFHFSDTWQLVVNTATTIVTFLMVFLIQNTQNRDTKALHLKLDELLRALAGARTSMVNLEHLSDEELERLQLEFERVQGRAENGPSTHVSVNERTKGLHRTEGGTQNGRPAGRSRTRRKSESPHH